MFESLKYKSLKILSFKIEFNHYFYSFPLRSGLGQMKELRESFFKRIKTVDDLYKAIQLISKKLPHSNQSLSSVYEELLVLNNSLLPIELFLHIFSFFPSPTYIGDGLVDCVDQRVYRSTLFSLLQVSRLFNEYFNRKEFFSPIHISVNGSTSMELSNNIIPYMQNVILETSKEISNKSFLPFNPSNLKQLTILSRKNVLFLPQLPLNTITNLSLFKIKADCLPRMPQLKSLTLSYCLIDNFKVEKNMEELAIMTPMGDDPDSQYCYTKLIKAVKNANIKRFTFMSGEYNAYYFLHLISKYKFCSSLEYFLFEFSGNDPAIIRTLIKVLKRLSKGIISTIILSISNMSFPVCLLRILNELKVATLKLNLQIDNENNPKYLLDLSQTTTLISSFSFPIHIDSCDGSPLQKLSFINCEIEEAILLKIIDKCKHLKAFAISSGNWNQYPSLPYHLVKIKALEFVAISRGLVNVTTVEVLKNRFGSGAIII